MISFIHCIRELYTWTFWALFILFFCNLLITSAKEVWFVGCYADISVIFPKKYNTYFHKISQTFRITEVKKIANFWQAKKEMTTAVKFEGQNSQNKNLNSSEISSLNWRSDRYWTTRNIWAWNTSEKWPPFLKLFSHILVTCWDISTKLFYGTNSEKINCCWRESTMHLLFYCSVLPPLYIIDQQMILMYKIFFEVTISDL